MTINQEYKIKCERCGVPHLKSQMIRYQRTKYKCPVCSRISKTQGTPSLYIPIMVRKENQNWLGKGQEILWSRTPQGLLLTPAPKVQKVE